jgi:Epoxide hydrolase N terminus
MTGRLELAPFRIDVPEDTLADLRDRLARTRWPGEVDDAGWDQGTNLAYLRALCGWWRDGFDWRAQERALNRLPQFRATVDGLGIHLVHVRGRGPSPFPLVITHGWPSSFVEFRKLVPLLADPAGHGGSPADGHGSRAATSRPNVSRRRAAPAGVTWTARPRSARRSQPRSNRRRARLAPTAPARWWRCSLQSTQ